MSSTLPPIAWKASLARCTVAAPSVVRAAPASTTPTVRAVASWMSPMRVPIVPAEAMLALIGREVAPWRVQVFRWPECRPVRSYFRA
jgi:hypothetical protein